MLTGNKGEWSELYVFAKLLADGKLFQSDMNLHKNTDVFYTVVKAYRNDNNASFEYERKDNVCMYRSDVMLERTERTKVAEFSIDFLKKTVKILLQGINEGSGAFNISGVDEFIEKFQVYKLSAKVTSKSDIKLRLYDHRHSMESDLGFSIKSLLGSDSTLFNPGAGTNFIYKILPNCKINLDHFNQSTYNPKNNQSKITYRLNSLLQDYSSEITYAGVQSPILYDNLRMIDGDLPAVLSQCLLYRWIEREKTLHKVVDILEDKDPLNFYNGKTEHQRMYEFKIKKFLLDSAMGMTSETPWDGTYDTSGGIIICKSDGDIVCFHICDLNLFRDYLYKNTLFEQPSTGEDENNPGHKRTTKGTKKYYYGWLYEENSELYFKINLQVRFK